jgi:hypothetical protein
MAKHITIKIKVAYDKAHSIPSVDELDRNICIAVSEGLLDNDECVIEEWEVEIED